MGKRLHISDDLSLTTDAVTNTTFILARRRVGKTYTASVIAEEMVAAGLPWVALDPTGTWWGLGSSADGKSEGLPVIVIGGAHGHLPLEPGAGKIIANMVADRPGWYIIDFSNFDEQSDIWAFAAAFGRQLHNRLKKKPTVMKLYVDEADIFVPQKPVNKDHIECLRVYDGIIRRGGVNGLGSTMISQRPALINKDALTQADTLLVLQTGAPQDQDPVFDWVSRYGTKDQLDQIRKSMASLKMGQAWYFSPDSEIFKLIQIRTRNTFNSSATPKPGAKPIEPKVFASIDLQALSVEIQASVVKTQMQDPTFLQSQLRRAEMIIKGMEAKASQPAPAKPAPAPKIQKITVPGIAPKDIAALQKAADKIHTAVSEGTALAGRIGNQLAEAKTLQQAAERQTAPVTTPAARPHTVSIQTAPHKGHFTKPDPIKSDIASDQIDLDGPMRRILNALAWLSVTGQDKPTKKSVAFLAGYSPDGGGFTGPLSRLSTAGMIKYHPGQTMELTDAGRPYAEFPEQAATPFDIQEQAIKVIGRDGPMKRIFQITLSKYPDAISKDDLAAATGYAPKGGGFTGPLSRLSTAGLIEYPEASMVRAASFLFLE
jgi:uncharacterized protein